MRRDYQTVSPSLDGILRHESVTYDGFHRPEAVARIFDKPAGPRTGELDDAEKQKVIEQYSQDLYGLITKKLSLFAAESEPSYEEGIKLQALLQEYIKIKGLLGREQKALK